MLTRRLDPMNQERVELLDRLEREAAPDAAVVRAHPDGAVRPGAARSRAIRRAAARISCACSGRAYADPAPFIRQFLSEQYAAMIARFKAAFGRALPHLPRKELSWRLHFIMGALSYTLAGTDALKIIARAQPARDRQRRNPAAPARAVPARGAECAAARLDRSDARGRRRACAQALTETAQSRAMRRRNSRNVTMLTLLFLVLVLPARSRWRTSMRRDARGESPRPWRSRRRGWRTRCRLR